MEIIRGWEWYSNSKNDINYAKSNHSWLLASTRYSLALLHGFMSSQRQKPKSFLFGKVFTALGLSASR